ncbi:fibroblast growth factor receptor 3 isoform X1 [Lingula anatina]|uniref:receptor protein-tyrosine kinase n=1 Tax=Lingula anatina TaxID=7574 RepID=A0A1S3IR57_LINAN|nr:fibroblast growth factor receptor 3 isoform X1 [Lingula anatina]|eukprot:XP_013400687.1 fibroblast growth factor receptor 3 isoform X1 [Lingula anatina]
MRLRDISKGLVERSSQRIVLYVLLVLSFVGRNAVHGSCTSMSKENCYQLTNRFSIHGKDLTNQTYDAILGESVPMYCEVWQNSTITEDQVNIYIYKNATEYSRRYGVARGRLISCEKDHCTYTYSKIVNASPTDAGVYTCYGAGYGSANVLSIVGNITLNVAAISPLNLTGPWPETAQGQETDQVTFHCNGTGYPRPRYHWVKGGVEILRNSSHTVITDTGTLTIVNVTLEDAGNYSCTVHNRLMNLTSDHSTSFTVAPLPVLGLNDSDNFKQYRADASKQDEAADGIIAASASTAAVVILIILIIAAVTLKLRGFRRNLKYEVEEEGYMHYDDVGAANLAYTNVADDAKWETPREKVTLLDVVGEGAFGQVVKAEMAGKEPEDAANTVAVKMAKDEADKKDLLNELKVMKIIIPHPNVVRLLGCCTENDPVLVIIEFMPHGNLLSVLQKSQVPQGNVPPEDALTETELLSFGCQVASGMAFLDELKLLHRDLAARNVLVGEGKTCKISDFGLARDIIDSHMYVKKSQARVPIKWMAPESIFRSEYTNKSDVWSFGVLLWEIMTRGQVPYPGLGAIDVARAIQRGLRMQCPIGCRPQIYAIMRDCWQPQPEDRPLFKDVEARLKVVLQATENADEDNLQCPPNNPAVDYVRHEDLVPCVQG